MSDDLNPAEAAAFRAIIQDALDEHPPPGAAGRPAIVTGWVIVVECADGESGGWLITEAGETTRVWTAEGMLSWAIRVNNEVEGAN